ncbi:MAG: hypothetical protein ABSH53_11645 [Holophaga sp.]|jgi:hypothetical protein
MRSPRFALLTTLLAALPASAQLGIHPRQLELTTDQDCEFFAGVATSAPQPPLEFEVDPGGGTIVNLGGGKAYYKPPIVVFDGEETFTVRVRLANQLEVVDEAKVTVRNGTVMGRIMESGDGQGKSWKEPSMCLLAGDPAQPGFTLERRGVDMRFRAVQGMVHVPDHPTSPDLLRGQWLLLDQDTGLVQVLADSGRAWTWVGSRVQMRGASFTDGQGAKAGLAGPAHLALVPGQGNDSKGWRAYFTDHLGQTIRFLDAKGAVTTLAGQAMQEGYRNGPLNVAQFAHPTGIAAAADGTLYVADTDNHCIRMIKDGKVSTFAGRTNTTFQTDGNKGTFLFPNALALDEPKGVLYVTDACTVRGVRLQDRRVFTVAGRLCAQGEGQDDCEGFEEWLDGKAPGSLAGVRCFRYPCYLILRGRHLYVVDRGNHTIRKLGLDDGTLVTVAGNPAGHENDGWDEGRRTIRCGLLPNGKPLNPGERAALGLPNSLAFGPDGECIVSLGHCIAALSLDGRKEWTQARMAEREDSVRARMGRQNRVEHKAQAEPFDEKAGK